MGAAPSSISHGLAGLRCPHSFQVGSELLCNPQRFQVDFWWERPLGCAVPELISGAGESSPCQGSWGGIVGKWKKKQGLKEMGKNMEIKI